MQTQKTTDTSEEPSATRLAIPKRRAPRTPEPIRISEADEARLMLFFGELGAVFERSVSGTILERQEAAGAFSARCRRCKGSGIIDGPGGFGSFVEEVKATRQAPTAHGIEGIPDESARFETREREVATGGWCRNCRGTGAVPKPQKSVGRCEQCAGSGRVGEFPCAPCLGTGRNRLTAEPTGSSVDDAGMLPNEQALHLYAVVSHQVATLRSHNESCAIAIERLFGDQGARWARTSHGRLFSLYQETAAGKRLVRWSEARDAHTAELERQKARRKLGLKPRRAKKGWLNPKPELESDPFSQSIDARFKASKSLTEAIEVGHEDLKSAIDLRRRRDRRPHRNFIGPIREWPTWIDGGETEKSQHHALRPPTDLTPSERIASEVDQERKKPDTYRRKLLALAAEQSRQLYLRTCRLWVALQQGKRKPTKRQLEENAAIVKLHQLLQERGHTDAADYIAAQVASR